MNAVTEWALAHLREVAAVAAVLALLVPVAAWVRSRRQRKGRTPVAVVVAALAAMACTAYSADTSWRFAEHSLGMTSGNERAAMFAAAELALFATALMARQNLRAQGAPGTPGILVWLITGVQVIPAYAESGFVGGTVRAVVGPVLAALLWHLAMGIELRHSKPGADSRSLPAVIGRELRERLLSRLGLATRDRSAEQITRDRATARAVQLASRPALRRWGRARLAAAVARSGVGTDPEQRDVMMRMLAARRGALHLSTVELASPFEPKAPEVALEVQRALEVPEGYPALAEAVPAPPAAVPASVRLLPLASVCGLPPVVPEPVLEVPVPEPVPDHGYPVPGEPEGREWETRDEPEEEPDDDQGYPDPLTEQVRADFPGEVPGIRRLRETYRIGQPRAQRIRDELMGVRA